MKYCSDSLFSDHSLLSFQFSYTFPELISPRKLQTWLLAKNHANVQTGVSDTLVVSAFLQLSTQPLHLQLQTSAVLGLSASSRLPSPSADDSSYSAQKPNCGPSSYFPYLLSQGHREKVPGWYLSLYLCKLPAETWFTNQPPLHQPGNSTSWILP